MTYPQQPGPQQPAQTPQWPPAQQAPSGYAYQQPPVPYPAPPSQPTPQPPKRRLTGLIVTGAIVAVILVVAGVGVGVFALRGVGPFKDSGVAMCEQMRDAQAKGTQAKIPGATSSGDKWSVDTYHQIRKQFADSRYPDLRDAGTKLIDLAWQLFGTTNSSSNSDGALGAALVMGGQIMQDYSSLAGACANHGVDIPTKLGS